MSVEPVAARLCLLIEDQPRTRDWMLDVLASAFPDLRIETAGTLKSAHAWLDRHGADLWLAIIDIGLPDGSGVDIVRRLNREHPDVLDRKSTRLNSSH